VISPLSPFFLDEAGKSNDTPFESGISKDMRKLYLNHKSSYRRLNDDGKMENFPQFWDKKYTI
jgi:hypothetical protein